MENMARRERGYSSDTPKTKKTTRDKEGKQVVLYLSRSELQTLVENERKYI